MPSNSYLLHNVMGLPTKCMAYDFNLACSGHVYGVVMAESFIQSGLLNKILLVTAETYSKFLNKRDRSTRVLFGDAAAACLIEKTERNAGMIDASFVTSGKDYKKIYIPAGGTRLPRSSDTSEEVLDKNDNTHSMNDLNMDGFGIWGFINTILPNQIESLLRK